MGQSPSQPESDDAAFEEPDDNSTNTLDELQILEGHTDIVRLVCVVNHNIIATASDDCTIRLWDWRTGMPVAVLAGHKRPVTCLLKLSPKRIASGSSDEKIFIWNVQTGMMIRELSFHSGAVQCIIRLSENRLCSGGSDKSLLVWDQDGNEVGRIERQENENLHCMLSVSNRIVTGSSSSLLLVYNPETWTFVTILAYHRESVTCLERISQTHFVSGSLDGAIVIWHADTLKPSKILSFPDRYRSDMDHIYLFHVRSMVLLNQRYLVCAIGNGFALFDLYTGERILDKPDAHDAGCLQVLPLYKGRKIITCSDDSRIRVWGAGAELVESLASASGSSSSQGQSPASSQLAAGSPGVGSSGGSSGNSNATMSGSAAKESSTGFRNLFAKKKTKINSPILLGEMNIHCGSVSDVVCINQTSFVSVGSDGLVVIWKDGRVQRQLRNNLANASLLSHNMARESGVPILQSLSGAPSSSSPISITSPSPSSSSAKDPFVDASDVKQFGTSAAFASSPVFPPASRQKPTYSVAASTSPLSDDVQLVPSYIWSFALALKDEKKLSVKEVLDRLVEQGHSKEIIEAIERKFATTK